MYQYTNTMAELFHLLQDKLSQNLFWARLSYDINPSIDNTFQIIRTAVGNSRKCVTYWEDAFNRAHTEGKKIILYGPGSQGISNATSIIEAGKDFYAFCGRNFKKHTNGVLGKPVLSPQYLQEHADECYVIISTMHFYGEVYDELKSLGFPLSHILSFTDDDGDIVGLHEKQYLDFPQFYKKGTLFVDAGCFDCSDSLRFSKWCGGAYSKIIAFEPDTINFKNCEYIAQKENIKNFTLIHSGIGSKTETASFLAQGTTGSHFSVYSSETVENENIETIQIAALDDVIKPQEEVGFIKMDIEGAEYHALLGAKSIITRDKPLLAVCIYHKRGDMLAIMDLLHKLVPEYRFWIRHYSISMNETVLYAAVDTTEKM